MAFLWSQVFEAETAEETATILVLASPLAMKEADGI